MFQKWLESFLDSSRPRYLDTTCVCSVYSYFSPCRKHIKFSTSHSHEGIKIHPPSILNHNTSSPTSGKMCNHHHKRLYLSTDDHTRWYDKNTSCIYLEDIGGVQFMVYEFHLTPKNNQLFSFPVHLQIHNRNTEKTSLLVFENEEDMRVRNIHPKSKILIPVSKDTVLVENGFRYKVKIVLSNK
ncbi:ORF909 [White spot syndrome virus]|uniref:ORF909 n=1 Tax=White spot syndrome virus TaxID=342409 RepID=A0A2D3I522_9VIRU|nr:ORF909 [White spot syndrome virus]WUY11299.1 hypothetical protein [White spot syndrome virus]WUY11471.1 hypothetical protein [White spot syndrome virus]